MSRGYIGSLSIILATVCKSTIISKIIKRVMLKFLIFIHINNKLKMVNEKNVSVKQTIL